MSMNSYHLHQKIFIELFLHANKQTDNASYNCIASNDEKYISFSMTIVVDEFVNEEDKNVQVTIQK